MLAILDLDDERRTHFAFDVDIAELDLADELEAIGIEGDGKTVALTGSPEHDIEAGVHAFFRALIEFTGPVFAVNLGESPQVHPLHVGDLLAKDGDVRSA